MRILVYHDGQQFGPYTLEQIRGFVQAGSFQGSDLAWMENTPAWVTIDSLLSTVIAGPPPLNTALSPYVYPPEAPTSGLAMASMVLGVLSIACLSIFAGIPAILCGHAARARFARGHVREKGEGLALAGLIMGYFTTVPIIGVFVVFLVTLLSLGSAATFSSFRKEAFNQATPPIVIASYAQEKRLAEACERYAGSHHGAYPKTLDELIPRYVPNGEALGCPQLDQPGTFGFWYFGADLVNPDGDVVLLVSKAKNPDGERVIVKVNGTTTMEQSDPPRVEQ